MTTGLKKGMLVRLSRAAPLNAWCRMTRTEIEAWYKWHGDEVRAGRAYPMDSAGEPVLAPQDKWVSLTTDRVYQVVRSRCTAPQSWSKVSHCCQVLDFNDGETYYIRRRELIPA
jgi:phage baseplate assembly protein gpV